MLRRFLAVLGAAGLGAMAAAPAQADAKRDLYRDFHAAQQVTRGKGVTIALVGGGVDASVRSLVGRVTIGPDHVKLGRPKRLLDTLLASMLVGSGPTHDSPYGVRGLAPGARILSIRVRPEDGDASDSEIDNWYRQPANDLVLLLAKGIRHAADQGAQVIHVPWMVWGIDRDIRAAVEHAAAKDAVVVAGAYPRHKDYGDVNHVGYPAGLPGVIGVGAVDDKGKRDDKYSSRNSSILVAGLSSKVATTAPRNEPWQIWGNYPASAYVAATAALVKSQYPKLEPAQIAQAIVNSARQRPKSGYDTQIGFGIVNPDGALREARKLAEWKASADRGAVSRTAHFGGGKAEPIKAVNHDVRLVAAFSGAIGGGVLFLAASLALLLWRRRKSRLSPAVPMSDAVEHPPSAAIPQPPPAP